MESKVTNVKLRLPYLEPRVRSFYVFTAIVHWCHIEFSIPNKYY